MPPRRVMIEGEQSCNVQVAEDIQKTRNGILVMSSFASRTIFLMPFYSTEKIVPNSGESSF